MSSFRRLRFLLSHWREVLGWDTSLRDRTAAMQHELQRLRERRRVVESAREKEALDDLRGLIERMKTLEKDLNAAEMAVTEFVDNVGEKAKMQLEDDLNAETETMIETAMRKSRAVIPEPQQGGSPPSVSAEAAEQPQASKARGPRT